MTHLIDDLLDVGRINDGKLVPRESETMLKDVVEASIEASRPLIDEAGHELIVSMLPESASLVGDANRLTQALSNVLNNAACYTPRGGRIELTLERHDEGVRIAVADNGIGIPSDRLDDIFDIFTQADCSPDGTHEGLGDGLALTRRVLEVYGGSISVHSDGPGMGSTFTMHLPATVSVPASAPPSPAVPVEQQNRAPSSGSESNQRVLIVDDNPDVIESMSMLLEIMNIDVRTASSGSEAMEVAETYRPNVILMDIGMPGMSGLECARAIRQKEWGKEANLIAVTGWGQEEDVQRSLEAGFNNHLVKPMDPDALMALLS